MLVLLLLLAGSAYSLAGLWSASARVEHTSQVQMALAKLERSIVDAETAQRGYLASGDRRFLELYRLHRAEWHPTLDGAVRLTVDNPRQTARLTGLRAVFADRVAQMDATLDAYDRGVRDGTLASFMFRGKDVMDDLRATIADAQAEEERLAVARHDAKDAHARWTLLLFAFTTCAVAALVGVVWAQRRNADREASLARRQREANDRYRALVSVVGDITWTNSPEGQMRGPQPAWCSFTGQSEEEIQGYGWSKAVHADDARATLDAWKEAVATRSTFAFEHRLRRRDGVFRWFAVRAVPVFEPGGEIREWVGLHRDIDVEKNVAERERVARVAAEQASRVKDEFLAMLGHELRNPLSPILTAVQLLKLRGIDEREVSVIDRQAQHLTRLVEDLLHVSRITQGKVVLNREPVEMADVAAAAIEMASPAIEGGKHSLSVDVPTRGRVALVDRTRMAQVVSNLLTNAAKYSRPGGRIALKAARDGDGVVVRVEDSGEGIAPELLPHIFDLFVQSKQTLARSQGGMGLGLAIVKSLVTMHQGTVAAESDGPGRGSSFTVRLPALETESSMPTPQLAPPARAARQRRVLVVDDNTDGADMLAEAVGALGYETAVAHDGPEALKVAAEFQPHVALLDIGLPVMDGYELAERLREQRRGVKLFAITGYGQESDRQRSRAAGFQEHLTKPVDLDRLEELLERVSASPGPGDAALETRA